MATYYLAVDIGASSGRHILGHMENGKMVLEEVYRFENGMVKKGDMMNIDDIIDILAINLLGVVPDDENIIVSTNRGEPAVADDKSKAGQAYRNITARVLGEDVPLLDMDEPSFFKKIKNIFSSKKA